MFYKEIVGQEEAKFRLLKMVNTNRVSHALMLSGEDGCGNLLGALAIASHLLCKNKTTEGACGNCASCNKTKKLIHPDLHFVFPIIKSKHVKTSNDLIADFREAFLKNNYLTLNDWIEELGAENKQAIIPVEEAGDILKKLSYTSYEGGYRIMIIWQPERMNVEAANSLLKILEEPPEETLFLLVCSQPDRLLATIISRVQQIPFLKVDEKEIESKLVSDYEVPIETARQAAYLSNGNFREALSNLHKEEEEVSFLIRFQNFMRLALKFDCEKAIMWIEENALSTREKQKQFINYSLAVFRDSIMFNYGEKSLVKLSGSEKQFLEKFAPFVNQKNYEKLVDEFNGTIYSIERNANPKILFMNLLLKTNELINLK